MWSVVGLLWNWLYGSVCWRLMFQLLNPHCRALIKKGRKGLLWPEWQMCMCMRVRGSEIYWAVWDQAYCSQLLNPLRERGPCVRGRLIILRELSSYRWKVPTIITEYGNDSLLIHFNPIFSFLSLLTWARFSQKDKLLKMSSKQQLFKSSQRKQIHYRHGSSDTNESWLFNINNGRQRTMGKYL